MRTLILALSLSGIAIAGAAQTDARTQGVTWCDYHLETLAHTMDTTAAAFKGLDVTAARERVRTTPAELYLRAYLVYSGHRDTITAETRVILDYLTQDSAWRRHYHASYAFADGGHEYPLLVDDSLATTLLEEATPGDTVWAFVRMVRMLVGTTPHFIPILAEFGTSQQTNDWADILRHCHSQ